MIIITILMSTRAGTLRQAILDANANPGDDVIIFNADVTGGITLFSGLMITDGVTITGPGAHLLSLIQSNDFDFWLFSVRPGATLAVSNLEIVSAHGEPNFGAIEVYGALNATNCRFFNLNSYVEAAINIDRGTATIENCEFVENSGVRGAIFNFDGTLNVSNTTFDGNGGAILNYGFLNITNSTFDRNTSLGNGGCDS